jgi:2-dehydro-3-deoxy-D-arabinonate dehydratase
MPDALYRVMLADGTSHLATGPAGAGPTALAGGLSLDDLLAGPAAEFWPRLAAAPRRELPDQARVVAPVQSQPVWAAGVTYAPSRDARQAESAYAAIYQAVYQATRPELFWKSDGRGVRGPGEPVAIRSDSTWDVPEPEIALVLSSACEVVALTIGNDMSSRSIEGANPLYLPQAKVYDGSCALGPGLVPVPDRRDLQIELVIERGGAVVFDGTADASSLMRSFEDLAAWLGRALTFPAGAILLTGTPLIPPAGFTLAEGDLVRIAIEGLGALANPVTRLDCGDPPAGETPTARPAGAS